MTDYKIKQFCGKGDCGRTYYIKALFLSCKAGCTCSSENAIELQLNFQWLLSQFYGVDKII